jgi:hypothetical protein
LRAGEGTTVVICFAPEQTRITLSPGTEFKLTAVSHVKRFDLFLGKVDASVAPQRPFRPMILKTPQAEARVVGTRFTLTVKTNSTRLDVAEGMVRFMRRSDEQFVRVGGNHFAIAAANYELSEQPLAGRILREYWTNIPGADIAYLMASSNFPARPAGQDSLLAFEATNISKTNYGARIRGYLLPPISGDYTFWVACGGQAQLFLSSDRKPENRQPIAWSQTAGPREWDHIRSQQSAAVNLRAGHDYYIEVLQKSAHATDNLAVAWQGPDRTREVISGEFLSPFDPKK